MFCDGCGTLLQMGRFCSRCGKEIAGATVVGYPQRSRVREHIRLLGILWLALSALNAVGGVVLYILANTLFVHLPEMSGERAATAWLHPFLSFIGIVVIVKAAAGFLAGWGLLQREPWGAHVDHRSRLPGAVQYPVRDRARHLHALGSAAGRVRSGIPRTRPESQRGVSLG